MNWKEIYQSRVVDADTALKNVETGDRVIVPFAAGQPKATLDALARRIKDLEYINIAQILPITNDIPYLSPEIAHKVRFITSYVGAVTRNHVANGDGQFAPSFLKDYPIMYSEVFNPNVSLIQVSPPDKHGYSRLGTSVDHNKRSPQYAKHVIA